MNKVTVIGHFGFGFEYLDGQTVKTTILANELERRYGSDKVLKIDTHGGIKTLLKAPFHVLKAFLLSQNIVMLPAHNGLRVYAPLLAFGKKLFSRRRIHYAVVGGWLVEFLKNRPSLEKSLRSFDGIYVETNTMKVALESKGFENVHVMPNCKELSVLDGKAMAYAEGEPYKLCTFSRVMREKGIEDAVNAVIGVNKQQGRTVYTLDIYGPVDPTQTEWFRDLQNAFPDFVQYKGTVPFDQSVDVLKGYFALLFPTRFYTEGVPGTIIDAYAAGVPVVSAKWESFSDIVDDGVTGIGYAFADPIALENVLQSLVGNYEILDSMKANCVLKATGFLPEYAVQVLADHLI